MWTIELSGAATIIEMRKKKALTVARQGLVCELDKLIFDVPAVGGDTLKALG